MANEVLNSILKEYEQKKLKAELELEKRKEKLYQSIPRLQEIETELNNFAISAAKDILLHQTSSFHNLNEIISKRKQEKSDILKKANISDDFLIPHYGCSLCKDTGYVTKNNYKTEMCNCLKQQLLDASFYKSNLANLEKENFETFKEDLFSDQIDLAKYHFNISPKQNIKNIKQRCQEFVKNFDNPDVKNLLFTGNTGLR